MKWWKQKPDQEDPIGIRQVCEFFPVLSAHWKPPGTFHHTPFFTALQHGVQLSGIIVPVCFWKFIANEVEAAEEKGLVAFWMIYPAWNGCAVGGWRGCLAISLSMKRPVKWKRAGWGNDILPYAPWKRRSQRKWWSNSHWWAGRLLNQRPTPGSNSSWTRSWTGLLFLYQRRSGMLLPPLMAVWRGPGVFRSSYSGCQRISPHGDNFCCA